MLESPPELEDTSATPEEVEVDDDDDDVTGSDVADVEVSVDAAPVELPCDDGGSSKQPTNTRHANHRQSMLAVSHTSPTQRARGTRQRALRWGSLVPGELRVSGAT